MCIRDSAKIELSKHDSTKVIAAVKKWVAKLDPKDKEYEHHPVSYTHLRAHETVLDLVCRLLLEKNKKKQEKKKKQRNYTKQNKNK